MIVYPSLNVLYVSALDFDKRIVPNSSKLIRQYLLEKTSKLAYDLADIVLFQDPLGRCKVLKSRY